MQDTAVRVNELLSALPIKRTYEIEDLRTILDKNFDTGVLVCRLFMGLSKDVFVSRVAVAFPNGGSGATRYKSDSESYLNALLEMGVLDSMSREVNRRLHWSDRLVERLRSGRGSAIAGQRRGRVVEDLAEELIAREFGNAFDKRCSFTGKSGRKAKCDFAIPSKAKPQILIESKGYNATGSKMSDIIGDVQAIIDSKRRDTYLLFVTDGTTWRQQKSDLKKIVKSQNDGDFARIYTRAMSKQFEVELVSLKLQLKL